MPVDVDSYSLTQIAVFWNQWSKLLSNVCSECLPFTFTHTCGSKGQTWSMRNWCSSQAVVHLQS